MSLAASVAILLIGHFHPRLPRTVPICSLNAARIIECRYAITPNYLSVVTLIARIGIRTDATKATTLLLALIPLFRDEGLLGLQFYTRRERCQPRSVLW